MAKSKRSARPVLADTPPPSPTLTDYPSATIKTAPFPIVGIGASAGGLEAFTRVLHHLPADTGMTFVSVQHLSPRHPSMLASLLSRSTAMQLTVNSRLPETSFFFFFPDTRMRSPASAV